MTHGTSRKHIESCPSLEAVVRPAAELEVALLLVEGEVLDLHLARRREYGRRRPLDATVVVDDGLRHGPDYEVAVGAVTNALLRGLRQNSECNTLHG